MFSHIIKRFVSAGIIIAFISTQCGISFAATRPQNLRKVSSAEAVGDGSAVSLFKAFMPVVDNVRQVVNAGANGTEVVNAGVFQAIQARLNPIPEYDRAEIIQKIKPYIDPKTGRELPEYRSQVTDVISEVLSRTNKGRSENVEAAARDTAVMCLNNGVLIVANRHSRAFDTAAKLFANAVVVTPSEMQASIADLQAKTSDEILAPIQPEVRFLVNLLAQDEISGAQISGGTKRLVAQIGKLRESLLAKESDPAKRKQIIDLLEAAQMALIGVRQAFENAPKRHPVFNVELSNAFIKADAYAILWTNEGYDSLDSPDPEMAELVKEGRQQFHATPNSLEWLKYADDWIEALPAYASYIIVPTEKGYRAMPYTERAVMEALYKSYAEAWTYNVEWAMQTEHLALARNYLLSRPEFNDRIKATMESENVDKEEAIRRLAEILVKEGALSVEDITNVAAIIWVSYFHLRPSIQARAQKIGYEADRYQLLQSELSLNQSEGNLYARLTQQQGTLAEDIQRVRALTQERKLTKEAKRMEWTATNRRREIPALHVMTTLGPEETGKIQSWVEESMSLYLICRQKGLEPEVARRQKAYKARLDAVKKRLAEELALDTEKPEENAKLMAEVARLSFLIESERPVTDSQNTAEDVSEPAVVTQYLAAHSEINARAEEFVVSQLASKGTPDQVREKYAAQIRGEALRIARNAYMQEKQIRPDTKLKERTGLSAAFYIRRDLAAENRLSAEVDSSTYKYTASGYLPDWYIIYAPSRVDLGPEIVSSERDTSKVCSADNPKALRRALARYSLYNINPLPLRSTAEGEVLKTSENALRGITYYSSLGVGAILDAIGRGDFQILRAAMEARGDRKPLPGGESYRGFCVPKEFCLIADVIRLGADPKTRGMLFDTWGIPNVPELRAQIAADFQTALDSLPLYANESEILEASRVCLGGKYSQYVDIAQRNGVTAVYLARLPELLQMMVNMNVIQPTWLDEARRHSVQIADWTARKMLGMEEVNRIGPFRKLLEIHKALLSRWDNDEQLQNRWGVSADDTLQQRKEKFRSWVRSLKIVGCPPYKEGTQDYRFSAYAAFLEIASGLSYHLLQDLDPEARQMMHNMLTDMFGSVTAPTFGGIMMVGPVGWEGVAGNMPDFEHKFSGYAQEARAKIRAVLQQGDIKDQQKQDEWIDKNARLHGLDFANWEWEQSGIVPRSLFSEYDNEARAEIAAKLYDEVSDQLVFLVFGTNFNQIADSVRNLLINAGVGSKSEPTKAIAAYSKRYGSDLRQWPEIKEMFESHNPDLRLKAEAVICSAGPVVNMLVTRETDVYTRNQMDYAVARADVVNLGVPETELLDLFTGNQLPVTLADMRRINPDGAFIFADGTMGGRFPFAEFRDPSYRPFVKRLLNLEPKAVYVSLGVGQIEVEKCKRELQQERQMAKALLDTVSRRDAQAAQTAFNAIKSYLDINLKAKEANDLAGIARDRKLPSYDSYRYEAEVISGICSGAITLSNFDFTEFLVIGGRHLVDGAYETAAELQTVNDEFSRSIAAMAQVPVSASAIGSGAAKFVKWAIGLKPVHIERPFAQLETGVRTSMKDIAAAFGAVAEYLSRINALERKRAMAGRKALFDTAQKQIEAQEAVGRTFENLSQAAIVILPAVNMNNQYFAVAQTDFGRYLAHTKYAYIALLDELNVPAGLGDRALKAINEAFKGGEITEAEYVALSKILGKAAESAQGDRAKLEHVAQMGELLDIVFVVENCFRADIFEFTPHQGSASPAWKAVAGFMDKTINNHIYDYWPLHIDKERGAGFEGYTREERFELAARTYQGWLYPFLRWTLVNKTEMALLGPDYADRILGQYTQGEGLLNSGIVRLAVGVDGDTHSQRIWFSYARIRDLSVLRAEGNPLPEILENVSPDVIDADNRTNVVIVYPMGNTTIPYALKRNPQQNQHGVNVISCGFPKIETASDGKKYLRASDAFTWMSKEDYRKALLIAGVSAEEANQRAERVDAEKGIVVLMKFTTPIVADAIWFHTFNHMRTRIDECQAALIQPFTWEALTHLKASYREMYMPFGITTPPQREFYMSRSAMATRFGGAVPAWIEGNVHLPDVTEQEQADEIRAAIIDLCKEARCTEVIIKPETESGGRGTEIFQIYGDKRELDQAVAHAVEALKVDDIVVQAFIRSRVRQAFSGQFVNGAEARFAAELGLSVDSEVPVFSYWRSVITRGAKASAGGAETARADLQMQHRAIDGSTYYVTHYMGVMSTEGVGNVGRGGRLFMLRNNDLDRKLNPLYRDDIQWTLNEASFRSMQAQRAYLAKNWRSILADYLKHHPEFAEDPNIIQILKAETLPDRYLEIPYEMGDYITKWLVDEQSNLLQIYNWDTGEFVNLYDEQGARTAQQIYDNAGNIVAQDETGKINLFDKTGARRELYYRNPLEASFNKEAYAVRAVTCTKMEPNPLAGLWGPHSAREAIYGVPADQTGCYWIFQLFGMNGAQYKEGSRGAVFTSDAQAVEPAPARYISGGQADPAPSPQAAALSIALRQMNFPSEAHMTQSDFSIVFEHYLAITGKDKFDTADILALTALFTGNNADLARRLLTDPVFENYRNKVAQIAREIASINQRAPQELANTNFVPGVRIMPAVLTKEQTVKLLAPDSSVNVGVVFNGPWPLAQMTVARLQQDADKAVKEGRLPRRINVFGIPIEALTAAESNNVRSVLYAPSEIHATQLDSDSGVRIDYILPRELTAGDELASHRQIAEFAIAHNVPIACSIEAAVLADNKAETYVRLEAARRDGSLNNRDVVLPAYASLAQDHSYETAEEIDAVMAQLTVENIVRQRLDVLNTAVYIQPATGGTEGRGTRAFLFEPVKSNIGLIVDIKPVGNALQEARQHVNSLSKNSSVILREERGNIFYLDEQTQQPARVTFRVNAGFDGVNAFAETGYAQVAANPQALITSVEQGGHLEDINIALHSLYYRDAIRQWQKFNPTADEINRVKKVAADIARVMNIGYAGIDFVIEVNRDGRLNAIVPLDINARGVLSPSTRILETEELPADYRAAANRELAPVEFWKMATAAAANRQTTAVNTAAAAGVAMIETSKALIMFENWRDYPELIKQFEGYYGTDRSVLEKEFARYARSVSTCINSGMAKPNQKIAITRVPGRLRGIGNAHDYIGLSADGVTFATREDLIVIAAENSDSVIRINHINPGKYPTIKVALDDYMLNPYNVLNPGKPIQTPDEWDAWVTAMHNAHPDDSRLMIEGKTNDKDQLWFNGILSNLAWQNGHGRKISGMNIFVAESSLPADVVGGLSTSSTLAVAASLLDNAINNRNRSKAEMAEDGLCERIYFGTKAGYGDHAAILFGVFGKMIILGINPVCLRGTIDFPQDLIIYLWPTVDRQLISHLVDLRFKEHVGGSLVPEELNTAKQEMTTWSSIGARLALLYFQAELGGNFQFTTVKDLFVSSYDPGTAPRNLPTEQQIKNILKSIPASISKANLLAQLEGLRNLPGVNGADLDAVIKLIAGLTEPTNGFRLRGLITYFISLVPKIDEFKRACDQKDITRIFEVVRVYHDGERVYDFRQGRVGVLYDGTPSDAQLDSNVPLWQLAGCRDRSLSLVDEIIDMGDAMHDEFIGTEEWQPESRLLLAEIIAAAGFGGQVEAFVPNSHARIYEGLVKQRLKHMFAFHVIGRLLENYNETKNEVFRGMAARLIEEQVIAPLRQAGQTDLAKEVSSKIQTDLTSGRMVDVADLVSHYYNPKPRRFSAGEGACAISFAQTKEKEAAVVICADAVGSMSIAAELYSRGYMPDHVFEAASIGEAETLVEKLREENYTIGCVVNATGANITQAIAASIGSARVVTVDISNAAGTKEALRDV